MLIGTEIPMAKVEVLILPDIKSWVTAEEPKDKMAVVIFPTVVSQ